MKYAAYEDYKSSASDWLGSVPSHWHVNRLKWSTNGCFNGVWGDEPNDLEDLICVRVADFDRERFVVVNNPPTIRAIEAGQRRNRLLQKNDLLIEKSGGGEKQLVGCVVQFTGNFPAVCSNFVARLPIARGCDPRYLTYLHSAIYAARLNYPAIKQTTGIQNLDSGEYLNILAAYPPLDEQQTIARFLDAKTAQIDDLIAKKRQLIDKLKEKRSTLIARTVTRGQPPEAAKSAGLTPHPEMKDSGVEWLGAIPCHWELKPIKYLGRVGNGSTPARDNSDYWDDGFFPWLNSSMVNENSVSSAQEFVTASALRECHLPIIKPPAILIGITGQGRTRGMATTLLIEATINQHVAYVKPIKCLVDVDFLRRIFDNAYLFLRSESDGGGSTKGAITCDQIANLNVPLPPLGEQQAIATYLDRETTQLDGLAAKVETAIARLAEYRQALITSAVTGKIDLRALAPCPANVDSQP